MSWHCLARFSVSPRFGTANSPRTAADSHCWPKVDSHIISLIHMEPQTDSFHFTARSFTERDPPPIKQVPQPPSGFLPTNAANSVCWRVRPSQKYSYQVLSPGHLHFNKSYQTQWNHLNEEEVSCWASGSQFPTTSRNQNVQGSCRCWQSKHISCDLKHPLQRGCVFQSQSNRTDLLE